MKVRRWGSKRGDSPQPHSDGVIWSYGCPPDAHTYERPVHAAVVCDSTTSTSRSYRLQRLQLFVVHARPAIATQGSALLLLGCGEPSGLKSWEQQT